MTSPIQIEKNKDKKVDGQGLGQLPQPTSHDHKCIKGVKKHLTLDEQNHEDNKNMEEDPKEEGDEATLTSKRKSKKLQPNDQTVENPLKRKKKSTTKVPIALKVFASTKTQTADTKTVVLSIQHLANTSEIQVRYVELFARFELQNGSTTSSISSHIIFCLHIDCIVLSMPSSTNCTIDLLLILTSMLIVFLLQKRNSS